MLERNVLSDGRKKAPVEGQGRRGGERLIGFNLYIALWSPVMRLVAYFGVKEVIKTKVLRSRVKELKWTR